MLDPRIAQRQIELEQRKKQQQKKLQQGQNSTKTAPIPAISPAPAAQNLYHRQVIQTQKQVMAAKRQPQSRQ